MSTSPFFNIAQQAGDKVAPFIEKQKDVGAIDDIFAQVAERGEGANFDDLMSQIVSRVSPQNQQAAMNILQQKKAHHQTQQKGKAYEKMGIDPSVADLDESVQREIVKAHQASQKKKETDKDELNFAFDRVTEILESGSTGLNPLGLIPGTQTKEDRAEFDTLSEMFIANLIPIINPRGVLSKARFDYIKSLVPQSGDTNAVIRGKLKGLKEIFQIGKESNLVKKAPAQEEINESVDIKTPTGQERMSLQEIFG